MCTYYLGIAMIFVGKLYNIKPANDVKHKNKKRMRGQVKPKSNPKIAKYIRKIPKPNPNFHLARLKPFDLGHVRQVFELDGFHA